jgi:hypothetical protein
MRLLAVLAVLMLADRALSGGGFLETFVRYFLATLGVIALLAAGLVLTALPPVPPLQ